MNAARLVLVASLPFAFTSCGHASSDAATAASDPPVTTAAAPADSAIATSAPADAAAAPSPAATGIVILRDAGGVPQAVATMSAAGSMHLVLSAPAQTTVDLPAKCTLEPAGIPGGGLRILGRSAQASLAVIGSGIERDGDLSWAPDGTQPLSEAPLEVDVALGGTSIFTGGKGSSTTMHVAGDGHTGTATFANATAIQNDKVGSASGTISWTCT